MKRSIVVVFCLVLWYEGASARDFLAEISAHGAHGRADSTLVTARLFARTFPDSANAHGVLGMVYAQLGQPEGAIEAFETAIGLGPNLEAPYDALFRIHAQLNRGREALDVLNRGLAQIPNSVLLLMDRAILYQEAGNPGLAVQDLRAAISLEPRNIEAYQSLAGLHVALKDPNKALSVFDEGLKNNPESVVLMINQGQIYGALGKPQDASQLYERAILVLEKELKKNPNDVSLLVNKGAIYHSMRRTGKAFAAYRQAVSLAPDDPEVHRSMGQMAAEVDSLEVARKAWEKVSQLEPRDLDTRSALARLYTVQRKWDLALNEYRLLMEIAPESQRARLEYGIAQVYLQKGDIAQAKSALEATIGSNPNVLEPYGDLALIYAGQQDLDSALVVYSRALAVDSTNAGVLFNIGLARTSRREFDLARRAFEKAIAYSPNEEIAGAAQVKIDEIEGIQSGKLWVYHILVETEVLAQEVLNKLNAGEDFRTLARQYSSDTSAETGGDLGFFSPGDLNPAFEEAVLKLRVGETSGVVQTPLGYHIIRRLN